MDRALLRLLRTRGHPPALERAAQLYARAGENGVLWFAVALVVRDRRAARIVLAALLANTALKQVVRRPRPDLGPQLPPLAATVSSFAAAGALSLPSVPLYAAAGAMALTRPYLGVHYPSDVLSGAALGVALEKLL